MTTHDDLPDARDPDRDATLAQRLAEIHALCLQIVRYEDELVEVRRENARLRAQIAAVPRKAPHWRSKVD